MTPTTRRERARAEAHQVILSAARAILREVGPLGLSLREVARRAEYSPAALYEYFDSKEAILLALFIEGFATFEAALRLVPVELPARDRLRRLGHAYVEFANANPEYYLLMFSRPFPDFTPTEQALAHAWRTFEILLHCVADGVAAGVFRARDDTEVMATAVTAWTALHGFVSLRHAQRLEMPVSDSVFIDFIMHNLYHGFAAAPR